VDFAEEHTNAHEHWSLDHSRWTNRTRAPRMHHDQNEEERGPTTAPALKLALGGFRISMTTDCLEHFVALTASHIPYCNDGRRRPDKIEQRIAEIAMATKVPNPIDKYVGGRVRMRRLMLGMSQEKLGDKLGITFQQVQNTKKARTA
jgi:ribosome-binding protein aMBF1 (putative translation factor)